MYESVLLLVDDSVLRIDLLLLLVALSLVVVVIVADGKMVDVVVMSVKFLLGFSLIIE